MLAAAKMFTRLAANAHLLLMCILVPRQPHSRASNNIYNGCLVSPRYHCYLQHISALLILPLPLPPHTDLQWWSGHSNLSSSPSPGLILVISVVGRLTGLNCPVNQILIITVFVFTSQRGGEEGWGSRLEIYLSVINHQTRAMNEKMS